MNNITSGVGDGGTPAEEFLRTLITELTHREALDATALIHRDDLADNWQARQVLDAVEHVARDGVDAGHAAQPLPATDVNAHLLDEGHLTNEAFRAYWLALVSPPMPAQGGKYRLRTLAARITEHHFRQRHAEIYGRDDSHVRPLEEITTEMNKHREELLHIFARIRPASGLALVKEASA